MNEILEQVKKELAIDGRWDDPASLADLLPKLVSLYSSLGQYVADAERDEALAETHYKVVREQIKVEKLKAGETVKSAEAQAFLAITDDIHEYIRLRHLARLLFLTRQSLDKTMDAARSKISMMKSDREGSRSAV